MEVRDTIAQVRVVDKLDGQPPSADWESEDGECRVLVGDCRERMRELPENSVDAIVTDPPAGIAFMNKEFDDFRRARNQADAGRENVFGRTSKTGPEYGRGVRENFIEWLQAIAEECLRVAKPGAHALVWAIPRTSHWTATAWENAGWVCRDRITHLTGQGFPKGLDIGKAIDREAGLERERIRGVRSGVVKGSYAQDVWSQEFKDSVLSPEPISDDAKQWDGWNVALKPAAEDWWLFRKPISEKTVAANVLRWNGCGALNIGACRIGAGTDKAEGGSGGLWSHIRDGKPFPNGRDGEESTERRYDDNGGTNFADTPGLRGGSPQGRWPANVLLSHHPDCVCRGMTKVDGNGHWPASRPANTTEAGPQGHAGQDDLNEKTASGEKIEAWDCHPDCPCAMFPESVSRQAKTVRRSNGVLKHAGQNARPSHGTFERESQNEGYSDAGSAARFFAQFGGSEEVGEPTRFRYQAKAGKSGRWFFCRDCQSAHGETDRAAHAHGHLNEAGKQDWSHIVAHPTVKPCGDGRRGEPGYRDGLMNYLCRLITPPGGLILDPFGGTGTTGVAAMQEGFLVILCEQDHEYAEIIKARMKSPKKKIPKSSQSPPIPKPRPANKQASQTRLLFSLEME